MRIAHAKVMGLLAVCSVHGQAPHLFDTLGQGVAGGAVFCFEEDASNDVLYIGGEIGMVGWGQGAGVMQWDGLTFEALGCGLHAGSWNCTTPIPGGGTVYSLEFWNGELYAGGYFDHSGMTPISCVARWDGSQWQPLGLGVAGGGYVASLRAYPDGLYAAGWFNQVDTVVAHGLARWDGTRWYNVHDLPLLSSFTDVNGINDMAIYEDELYIGGNIFDDLETRNDIARWDGTAWVGIGNGFIGPYSQVNHFDEHDGLLYVAGSFADYPPYGSSDNPGSGILGFDGNNWVDLGGGTDNSYNPSVANMLWKGDTLYVQGIFDQIGGVPCDRFARWDGTRWCAMTPPDYFTNSVVALGLFRDTLYLGGSFDVCGPDSINRVAKWIGGSYVDSCGFGVGVGELAVDSWQLTVHPNPASSQITISGGAKLHANTTVVVHDALGREVLRLPLPQDCTVQVGALPGGAYNAQLQDATGRTLGRARFIKE